MLTKEEMELPDRVATSFNDMTVLITGGTGFMGKVLVEKILRKCPAVKQLILIIRERKGKTATERLMDCLKNPLYDQVRDMYGGYQALLTKVCAVAGDCQEADLGISPEDRKIITDSTDIVIHCAATVRFDESIKKAVLLNTRGTKLMLELGKECKHLELFLHISTAYCHLEEEVLEEKAYPPPANPHDVIKAMETLDDDTLDGLHLKILDKQPNTYGYSKALSEGLVVESMEQGMPSAIIRPSIVLPTYKEPFPGWVDNINGPVGLMIGAGKGVIRSMYCKSDGYLDFLPVDVLINCIMVAVWQWVVEKEHEERIANFTSSAEIKRSYNEIMEVGRKIIETDLPANWVAWYPGGSMKSNRLYHNVCLILFHLMPALLVDGILRLVGQEPVLLRVQRRVAKGFEIFEFYTNNQWYFKSDIGQRVRNKLNAREKKDYICEPPCDGSIDDEIVKYFRDCILMGRKLIFNWSDDTLPMARLWMKIMWCVDRLVRGYIYYVLIKWFYYKATNYFGVDPTSIMPAAIRGL